MYFESESKALFIGDALHAIVNDPLGIIIDSSGSIRDYVKTLDFFTTASYKALCPAGDEPLLSNAKHWTNQVSESFKSAYVQGLQKIISDKNDTLSKIFIAFSDRFGPSHSGHMGQDLLNLTLANIVEFLVKEGKVERSGSDWSNYKFKQA